MLIVNGTKYLQWNPSNEEKDFHPMIRNHSKEIFGENSIYFDVKQLLRSSSGLGSIPDAYVIDLSKKRWYVVENELASHPVYDHVVRQLSKFINGIENQKTKDQIIDMMYNEINKDSPLRTFVQKSIKSTEIYQFLSKLISQTPKIVVVIDEKGAEVEEAVRALRYDTLIVEFKTFVSEKDPNLRAHSFNPIKATIECEKLRSDRWADKLEETSDELRSVLEELERRISTFGKITSLEKVNKTYYKGRKMAAKSCFAVIEIADSCLIVRIDANSQTFQDPENWSIGGIHSGRFFRHESKFKVTNKGQVDYSISLIKQAFDLTESSE